MKVDLEDYKIPWYMGVAHIDVALDEVSVYPIPLNWIMRLVYTIVYRIRFPNRTQIERRERQVWRYGFEEGRKQEAAMFEQKVEAHTRRIWDLAVSQRMREADERARAAEQRLREAASKAGVSIDH